MDTKIAATGEAIGSTLAKYRSEFMMLLAVCIMIGGYVFSAFMYKDICVFIQAQTEAQVETAKTLAEMNVRLSELEMEHKAQRMKATSQMQGLTGAQE